MPKQEYVNSAIPLQTIINQIGEERWAKIRREIFKKYKTTAILVEFCKDAPQLRINGVNGERLGTIAKLERWAKKQRQKRVNSYKEKQR